MRIIKLGGTPDEWADIEAATSVAEVVRAVGRLSTWSRDGYGFVEIHPNAQLNQINAVYRKEERGALGYFIAAVWHDGHFGFHS